MLHLISSRVTKTNSGNQTFAKEERIFPRWVFPGIDGRLFRRETWRVAPSSSPEEIHRLITSDGFAGEFARLEIHSMSELTLQRGREDSPRYGALPAEDRPQPLCI